MPFRNEMKENVSIWMVGHWNTLAWWDEDTQSLNSFKTETERFLNVKGIKECGDGVGK